MSELVESLRKAEVSAHVGHGGDWKSIYATAATLIEEQSARIATLEREREEWKGAANDVDHSGGLVLWSDKWSEMLKEYKWAYADHQKAEALLSEAVKVLESVTEAGKSWNDRQSMEAFLMISNSIEAAKAFIATLGESKN